MFIELWMCAVLAITFGICAWWNRQNGIAVGTILTLQRLIDEKIVIIEGDKIAPYRNSWAPKLSKRRAKK